MIDNDNARSTVFFLREKIHAVYKGGGWTPILEEMLLCQRKIGNTHDPFAVKVTESGNIVGHLPKKEAQRVRYF